MFTTHFTVRPRWALVFFSAISITALTACGGGSGDSPAPGPAPVDASMTVKSDKAQVTAGDGAFNVTAIKSGTTLPVSWSLSPGAQGTLDATTGDSVHYIPPASVAANSVEQITGAIDYDSSTAHVHLKSTVAVQIVPQTNGNTINVIQYNVKGNSQTSGGWNVDSIRNKQVAILANYAGSVDFITLEQATRDAAGSSYPLISDVINKSGWNTIVSHCDQDAIQIGYDANRWTPLNSLAQVQGRAVAEAGFGSCTSVGTNKSRPYDIVLFQRKASKPALNVLLIAVHMPHDAPDYIGWNLNSFFSQVLMTANVQSIAELKWSTHIVMVGDMNEVSDQNNYGVFSDVFGSLQASPQLQTCCSDSRTAWQYRYDRVLSNGQQIPAATILTPPVGITYPLGNAEEHKPVFATIKF